MANEIPVPKLPKPNPIAPQRPQSNIKPDVKELPVQQMQGVGSGDAKPIIADRSLLFRDLGTTGLTRFGGGVYEEFLRELQGASGVAIYREMRDNHPVVSALLFAIEMSLRQVRWHAEPASDSPQDKEAAEFLDEAREDMSYTWNDTMAQILTMLQFGFSLFEIIYKFRKRNGGNGNGSASSRYDDGHIGWRKWMPLAQDTLSPGRQWIFDESGGVQGIHQQAPPDWQLRTIPIEKLLLFRTSVAKGNPEGRALTLHTPIPTPSGWTTMGEIAVGDKVYDETGKIRYVVAKSEVWQDRPVYEVKFSSGHSVTADENHLWSVTTFNDRNNSKASRILSTREIADWLERGVKNPIFSTGRTPILDTPDLELPLDPYLLGYWLGDGSHESSRFGVHPSDFPSFEEQVKKAGWSCYYDGKMDAFVSGIKVLLRALGLLRNKHIPMQFLRASYSQRLALLQGLMDTDGYSPTDRDHASVFSNTNKLLIDQTVELIRSLGGHPRVRISSHAGDSGGTINGKPIVQRKDLYAVSFFLDAPIHRLARKLEKQTKNFGNRPRQHYIESVKPVGNADTVCVEVDSPSHLFLVGKGMTPTHNSLLRGMYTSYYYSKNMSEIEGIAAERMGAGIPVLYMGDNTTKSADGTSDLALSKQIVRDVRADEQMGVVIPYPKMGAGAKPGEGMLFELLSPPSRGVVDFDAVINRYDGRIALAALAQFIMLGLETHGSYALGRTHSDLFVMAIESWAESIAQIVNRHAVPRLFELNSFGITDYPKLAHSEIEVNNLQEMAQYVNLLVGASVLTPDANLEAALRQKARLPEKQETVTVTTTNTDELPSDMQEATDQSEQENQLNKTPKPKPPQTIKPPLPKMPTTYSERFAARRAYGGARYETATNDYQAELEQAYSDWYNDIAKKLSEAQTQDARDAILVPALAELEKQMKEAGRNGLLEAMQLGAADSPLSSEGLSKLSELIKENDKYIETSLVPAVRTKVTESLNDPLFIAGGLVAVTGLFDTFLGRIASYSGAFWEALHYGIKDNLMQSPNGMERKVRWVLDPGAEHCEDCPNNVGVYDSFDAMEATVGLPSQFVRCRQNCRCHVEVEQSVGSGIFMRL